MDFGLAVDKATTILSSAQRFKSNFGSAVCSFGFFNEKEEVAWLDAVCHARLRDGPASHKNLTKDRAFYYSTLAAGSLSQYDKDMGSIRNFGEWIISEDGPWKSLVANRPKTLLEKNGKVYGFLLEVDPEVDANVLANLSFASRVPEERLDSFRLYSKLVKEGLPPIDAYFVSSYFGEQSCGTVIKGGFHAGWHSIFNRYGGEYFPNGDYTTFKGVLFNFKRFLNGDPILEEKRPISTGGYTKVSRIFENRVGNNLKHLDELVLEQGELKGRWTSTPLGLDLKQVLDLWPSYRQQLLEVV